MSVVDIHRDLARPVRTFARSKHHVLDASRHRRHIAQGACDIMRREAEFKRDAEGGHHVLHIEFAHERILEGDRLPAHAKHDACACDIVSDLDRMNVSVLGESGRDHLVALFERISNEPLAPRAIDVDNALRRIISREEPPFRSKIRLECLVIVEVILRKVGESSDREGRIPHAIEIERM